MIRKFIFSLTALLSTTYCTLWGQTYIVEKLDSTINTKEFDEVTPIITHDGGTVYFTRVGSSDFIKTIWIDGKDVSNDLKYNEYLHNLREIYSEISGKPVSGNPEKSDFNQDIWYAESREKPFDHLVHPPSPLNNALPNSICSLTPDGDTYVVVNQFSKDGGMNKGFSLVKQLPDGTWSDPEPMQIDDYNISSAAISLTMSNDANVLIMSLPKTQGSQDNDLFISFKIDENHWSAPKNMGAQVNSSFKELTPYLSPDGKELYFASNRPPSVGGLDLFFISRLDDGWDNWTKPRRFVEPINTTGDESQPYFNMTTGHLYFSSKRDGTHDIYRVKIAPDVEQELTIKGRIINTSTGQPLDGRVMYGDADAAFYEKYVETIEGYFLIRVKQGKPIKMIAYKPGYINHEVILNYDKRVFFGKPQDVTLYLDSVAIGGTISLNPIYFKRSTPIILQESYSELDYLVEVMRQFTEISITVEGHTDSNGTPETLMKLSEDRAAEVRKYLIRNKIHPSRIAVIGYGATKPLSKETDEESRRLNRRVEFRITKIAY
ncbi:MAG: OmpA family protein [Saprospiraceae bacterium]|nr:OmpA family protein [Saprospiraceae bacterium]